MAIGVLWKSIKKSSCEGLDKLISLTEQISADCLTLISLASQNPWKVSILEQVMHFADTYAEVHRKTKCYITILCKQLTNVLIKLSGDTLLARVFSLLHWGVIAGCFAQIGIYFGTHDPYWLAAWVS